MTTLKHIMVGVDFSRHSEFAMGEALQLAQSHGAKLTVVHVAGPVLSNVSLPEMSINTSDIQAAILDERRKGMAAFIADFEANGVDITTKVVSGDPAQILAGLAASQDADLVMTASTGKGGFERVLIGATSERLVSHATGSAWISRAVPHRRLRRVLVATDFSAAAGAALKQAALVAAPTDALVEVINILPGANFATLRAIDDDAARERYRERLVESATDEVRAFVTAYRPKEIVGKTFLATALIGTAWRELTSYAAEVEADVIFIGSKGDSSEISRFFRGSTALRVVRHAGCSVCVVPPPAD